MNSLDHYAAVLHAKWKPGKEANVIIGEWAEDNCTYEVTVPPQLRNSLIALQNALSDRLAFTNTLRRELSKIESENKKIFL